MLPSVSVSGPGVPAEQPTIPVARLGYLSPKDAAKFLSVSHQELERLRRVGGGPDFRVPSPRLIRYSVEDLCKWMDESRVSNTAQAAELLHGRKTGVSNG